MTPSPEVSVSTSRGWTVLRFVIAAIILTAAFMKAWQLATMPSLGEDLLNARWFNILVVEFELFFGIWLIFGMLPRLTWLATVGCFAVFAVVSLYKAVLGEVSCGCFGAATINPWLTMLLDLLIIGLLVRFRPVAVSLKYRDICEWQNLLRHWKTILMPPFVGVVVAVPITLWITSLETMSLDQSQDDLTEKSVTLEPMNWIGKPFPLNGFLDVDKLPNNWEKGDWMLLLHHRNCPACKDILQELSSKVGLLQLDRLAIIEVPDKEMAEFSSTFHEQVGLICSLRRSSRWFAPSPVVLTLKNGIVAEVRIGNSARDLVFCLSDLTITGDGAAKYSEGDKEKKSQQPPPKN